MTYYDRKTIQQTAPYSKVTNNKEPIRNVYFGEVISTFDENEGGRIKVRIPDLDTNTEDQNLPDCYPLLPKFFHVFPVVGEIVRIFLEDTRYPQRGRLWQGSVISQLQNISFDPRITALNTTNVNLGNPATALSKIPSAQGVFPTQNEIALLGRNNADIILRNNETEIRAGKHIIDNVLERNTLNPSSLKLTIETVTGGTANEPKTRSSQVMIADKIAILSHDGIPKFPAINIDSETRDRIFKEGHPMTRGDILARILEIFRDAIVQHVHPYPRLPADQTDIINDLENLDISSILQENIVIN
jgi:hypothetical protein